MIHLKVMFNFLKSFFFRKDLFSSDSKLMKNIKLNRVDKININEISYNDVIYKNNFGETVLLLCIQNRFNDLAIFLIEKFPKAIYERNGEFDDSLINNSIIYNNFEIFQFLIKKNIDLIYLSSKKERHSLILCFSSSKFSKFIFDKTLDYSRVNDAIKKEIISNLVNYGYDDMFIKNIIKNRFFINSSTETICFSLKKLLKDLKFNSAEEIINMDNFKKDRFVDGNDILIFNKEGYFDNKLILKDFNYVDNFQFYKTSLINFHKIIGLKNKDNIRLFYENILKKSYEFIDSLYEVNYGMISCVFFIKKNFNIDENLLKKLFIKKVDFYIDQNNESKLKELLSFFPNKRVIQILSNGFSKIELRDTLYMYDSIKKYCNVNQLCISLFLFKKPKNIREIHNFFQIHINKIGKDNLPISSELPVKLLKLDNKKFQDFKINIPKNNRELILIGQKLAICVGNNFYAFSMANCHIVIFLLYKNDTIQYCIEYNIKSKSISQAKTYYNIDMNHDLKNDFLKFVNYHNS